MGRVSLPWTFQRRAEPLFDRQMWCWGCDIRRGAGNLLLAYGCSRRPAPEKCGTPAYTHTPAEGIGITLWGWGLWYAAQGRGSLFIGRSRFRVRYHAEAVLAPVAWNEQELLANIQPFDAQERFVAYELLRDALFWVADYERWLAEVDSEQRRRAIAAWPGLHRSDAAAESDLPAVWEALAQEIENLRLFQRSSAFG
ncbi:MAG: hypothetical protein SNJ59_01720 [Aggregatilineales bacterium]